MTTRKCLLYFIMCGLLSSNILAAQTLTDQAAEYYTSRDNWQDVIGHRDNVKIDGIDLFADHMVIYERENGLRQICVREFSSGKSHRV